MRSTICCSLLIAVVLAGFVPADSAGDEAERSPIQMPATFGGVLPCADCPGINWTLTLFEGGTYRLRRVYLEAEEGQDRAFVELGRWDRGGGTDRVVLRGGEESPIQLGAKDDRTLRLLDRQGRPIESPHDYELQRRAEVDRIGDVFPMRGEFTYMADAGWFSECRTGASLPVAQEGDNAALERAYSEARAEPGRPVLVTFEGRFAMRPPMEGEGLEEVIVVETFGEALPGQRCEAAVEAARLAGTYWRLTELPVEEGFAVDPRLRAHLVFDSDAGRVSGSSGCNRLIGTFVVDGSGLTFGPLAGTRMACPEPAMELEQRFHAALTAVTSYSIEGEVLTLLASGSPVARFERYLE